MRSSVRKTAVDGLCLLGGCICFGISVSLFSAPNEFAPGGIAGLSTILHVLWGVPIGATTVVLNLPLLIAAWFRLGRSFTVRTVVGIGLSAVVMDVIPLILPAFSGDRWLAALAGGCLTGFGLGLVLLRNASTGGTEIVARLMEKRWPHVSIGRLILLVDAVIIGLSVVAFRRLESALYAATSIFIATRITDRMIYGGRQGRLVLIFSAHPERLTEEITRTLGRGVTRFPAVGGYSGAPRPMLLCAVRRSQWAQLKALILRTDPAAFLLLLTADEVRGDGWISLDQV